MKSKQIFFLLIFSYISLSYSSNSISFVEYSSLCSKFEEKCQELTDIFIKELYKTKDNILKKDIVNTSSFSFNKTQISDIFYYKGEIEYFGIKHSNPKPNFIEAYKYFIISSYLNNSMANYKLYIGLKFGFMNEVFNNNINNIFKDKFIALIMTTKFWNNFSFMRNSSISNENKKKLSNLISNNFLYSSSINKYKPAVLNLANKILYGLDVEKNCKVATTYFKYLSEDIKDIVINITQMPSYFKLFYISDYESLPFLTETQKKVNTFEEVILYYNMEKDPKKQNIIIPEIATRYLYGLTTEQDLNKAREWLELGISRQIPICYSLYGELFLYGAGVERNYKQAYHYLNIGLKKGEYIISNNGLGFLYYNGLYVKRNKTQAYINFYNSIKNFGNNGTIDVMKSFYNMISVILGEGLEYYDYINRIESYIINNMTQSNATNITIFDSLNISEGLQNNSIIPIDLDLVYSHAVFLASNKNVLGTYILAMMNEYDISSEMNNCEYNIKLFKQISNRNRISTRRMKQMEKQYFKGNFENSFLYALELALEGFDFGISNAISLLIKKRIFNSSLRDYLLEYLIELNNVSDENDIFTLYNSANFHYKNKNYKKAKVYYKDLINSANNKINAGLRDINLKDIIKENNFYMAHGYFSLGIMSYFGWGMKKNEKRAMFFFENAIKREELSYYPISILKIVNYIIKYFYGDENGKYIGKGFNFFDIMKKVIKKLFDGLWMRLLLTIFIIFYSWFYYNLKHQDEDSQ